MRRWLDTLTNRTILVMLIGIGIVHVASLYAYQAALDREAAIASDTRLADRLLTIKRAVMRVAPEEREPVAHELSGGPIEAHWSRSEHAIPGRSGVAEWEPLRAPPARARPRTDRWTDRHRLQPQASRTIPTWR